MKKINLYRYHYLLLPLLFAGLLVILLSSCSRKMTFETSRIVPAASGSVTIKKSKNNNYLVDIKTLNLAKPQNLTPAKDVYVVWMRTVGNSLRKIGMIKSSSGLFSSTLKGELKATATSKPTSFFISAENDGNVQYPGDEVVLRTK